MKKNNWKKKNVTKKSKNYSISSKKIYIIVALLTLLMFVSVFKKAETELEKANLPGFDKTQMIHLNSTINSFLHSNYKKTGGTGPAAQTSTEDKVISREFIEEMKNSKTEEERKRIRAKDGLKVNLPKIDTVDKILLNQKNKPLKDYYYKKSQEFFKDNKVVDPADRQSLSFSYYIEDLKKYKVTLENKINNYKKVLK